ncbi:Mrp/NBP35 family ATP-binding protein [Jannaschia aquimarina]|uniref:Iron-sulfur cluster carrier protein n=1 Tax=Jannaschia aquimarina TaxID=935700 RepID=A0A0D1DAC0_9RHOB|nr:Mrp/NBP35 family ATP-binding protein [Jannaschia aquimarina]KIT16833.1 Flagellum site-determining protein YlxH [Jannaschia aquimarina]SNT13340.1 ATP-binding protein involved in chromosome partitioning [Jannaschia aquimarina]
MATPDDVRATLSRIATPDGGNLIADDMIRALRIEGERVSFIIEAPSAEVARLMEPLRAAAQAAVEGIAGVGSVQAVLTAPTDAKAPPSLKIGGHPKPQDGPKRIPNVARVIAIASGKGGVGKSTIASNLAVALARQGRKVGLLDADIHGPSQARMMGLTARPASPDGKTIIPLHAHGVTVMSIGLMLAAEKAVIWRGPMLMGALQQMMGQVAWAHHHGPLDILIVDLPPGTGDVQLTLCTKAVVTGSIVVSTPQDVALLDARKALDMFATLKTPVLGLIENMSLFHCPNCGHEAHVFGHGGVAAEAEKLSLPLLAALPIDLATRVAGDDGRPVASGDGPIAEAFAKLASGLIEGGVA